MLNTLTRMPGKGTRPESRGMALAAALRAALAAGLLVLLARARMTLGLAPFALALFAAGLYGRVHPAALVAGCALGALRFPLWETDVLFACGCFWARSSSTARRRARAWTKGRCARCFPGWGRCCRGWRRRDWNRGRR